ncbi:MAG: diacylglycerol kinase family lipid kinase [Anaerolineales bacterium]|nr:diacylglycerol kinase family lipid kinase [Anaerolineales bacterium]
MTKIQIILNPACAMGKGIEALPELEQAAARYKLDVEIVQTECPGHAIELARQAAEEGRPLVAAAGGDGTVNEVLNGLMQAQVDGHKGSALAVIPIGRGNDFAYGMNIPTGIDEAFKTLVTDWRRKMDVGLVKGGFYPEGRYFGNGVGIGFDAVVGFEAAKMKRLHGLLCYLVAALKTIFLYYKAPLVSVAYQNQNMSLRALMVSVMNGRRMGGSFCMAPEANSEDGLLDLCIAPEVSRLRLFALISHFMKGSQASQPEIITTQTSALTITASDGTLPAHADGETLCTEGQQLEISLLPQQLDLVCQQEGSTG